jgi:hypothetical protein
VSRSLCHAIEQRFAGARGEQIGDVVHADIPVDGAWYRARLAMQPIASVVVGLPCTDGFELALRWNDRWINGDGAPRAASFDDSFLVETNDLALAGVWLDHDVRSGLLASRYVSSPVAERNTALLLRDGRWIHQVCNDEVSAARAEPEPSADRMGDMRSSRPRSAAGPRSGSRSAASRRCAPAAMASRSRSGSSAGSARAIPAGCAR